VFIAAPTPRLSSSSEKTYTTIDSSGRVTAPEQLPCWRDKWIARREVARKKGNVSDNDIPIDDAEVFMSIVVPAYNEEKRLSDMLEEAVEYLQREYGVTDGVASSLLQANGKAKPQSKGIKPSESATAMSIDQPSGWEILIVSDGSSDKTVDVAHDFARSRQILDNRSSSTKSRASMPRNSTDIPQGTIRVVTMTENRGKGGAVTHGMRHVRGKYVLFADADGASRFEDLGKLVKACQEVEDQGKRGVAIGSRAWMVGSEAVVKVCSHSVYLQQLLDADFFWSW
jgi:dolichyl-phosphate beta-glucosyltransferase